MILEIVIPILCILLIILTIYIIIYLNNIKKDEYCKLIKEENRMFINKILKILLILLLLILSFYLYKLYNRYGEYIPFDKLKRKQKSTKVESPKHLYPIFSK